MKEERTRILEEELDETRNQIWNLTSEIKGISEDMESCVRLLSNNFGPESKTIFELWEPEKDSAIDRCRTILGKHRLRKYWR